MVTRHFQPGTGCPALPGNWTPRDLANRRRGAYAHRITSRQLERSYHSLNRFRLHNGFPGKRRPDGHPHHASHHGHRHHRINTLRAFDTDLAGHPPAGVFNLPISHRSPDSLLSISRRPMSDMLDGNYSPLSGTWEARSSITRLMIARAARP